MYRKKPIVINAWQIRDCDMSEMPDWLQAAFNDKSVIGGHDIYDNVFIHIKTLEGVMMADESDWIIKGVAGELYPCKNDIFQATYDCVVEETIPKYESKHEYFTREIDLIQNEQIKKFVIAALNSFDDYFFTGAASSSGKYHPQFALGVGGLVRHTKAAVMMAKDLLNLKQYKTWMHQDERDAIIASLILHDGHKPDRDHAKLCAEAITKLPEWNELPDSIKWIIYRCVKNHMGEWGAPEDHPNMALDRFVHECDYLASRKYMEINTEYEGAA